MPFQDFMTQTVLILKTEDFGTYGGVSSITTILTKGRLEPEKTLYRSETQGIVAASAKLFLTADDDGNVGAKDSIVLGGVKYTVVKKAKMRGKPGTLRHLELDLTQ